MKEKTRVFKDCLIEKSLEMFLVSNNNHWLDCKSFENKKLIERRKPKLNEDPE